AKTAPYFHDGSIPTLDACVQFMAYYQLGKFLDQETVDNIVAFLESLTGEYHDK
ncbi:cytochrome B6, partial [Campylobacter jejuni]|nr:cytochrome B6 [Campylobacter jejuni]ELR6628893.1 cytochrome B6 [Campylobacter jejuni]